MVFSKRDCRELITCVVLAIQQDIELLNDAFRENNEIGISFYHDDLVSLRNLESKLRNFVDL